MSYNESLNPNSNYPRMSQSEWDNAPFNEPLPHDEREFKCQVFVHLSKTEMIPTSDYTAYTEQDEDGEMISEITTENVNWDEDYKNNCYTALELFERLKQYAEQDLSMTGTNTGKGKELQRLISACDGWVVEETYIEEL